MNPPVNPTNEAAAEINAAIANANSVGVQMVAALLIARFPFLGFPVVKQILGYILSFLDAYISKAEQLGASFIVIDLQIGREETDVSKAIAEIIAAQKLGDPHAMVQAVKDFAAAQSALVHFDGSAPPQ